MKKYYKYFVFLILVLFVFLYSYLFLPLNMDGIWNYGFGYNISRGMIPYLDFNMIIPPLWPYLISIPIGIVGNKLCTYYVIIAIIISLIVIVSYKKIGYKSIFILLILILYPHNGYNIFCLFLLFILLDVLYSDKYKNNDILIAIIISMMVLTKQTMGLLIIPSIIYSKSKKKTIYVYLISFLLLLLYLVINNNLWNFIDYCFLGMFDFTSNGNDSHFYIIFSEVIVFIYLIYSYIKSKFKDFVVLYIIMFQILVFPIFESSHFLLTFIPVLYYLFINNNKLINYFVCVMVSFFLIGCYVRIIFSYTSNMGNCYVNSNSFINYKRLPKYTDYQFDMVSDYLDKYSDYRLYFFSSNAYLYKLEYDIPINKFDLINDGNMGYRGGLKYVEEVKNYCDSHKCIFIVKSDEIVGNYNQINREITKYVISNYLSIYSSNELSFYIN